MTLLISLVTGHWNRPAALQRLVESVAAHTSQDWELVVADASDVPFTAGDQRVRVLDDRPKTTMVRGYNRAFAATRGEWVVWLNDDMTVEPGWDRAAVEFMEAHPEIGLGALYYAEGKLPFHVNMFHDTVYANCGILRRTLGEELGWFDAGLRMYGSDNSLTWKVLLNGLGVVGIPGARLKHHVVNDEQRRANHDHATMAADVALLERTYLPRLSEIQATYRRTAHLQGPLELR